MWATRNAHLCLTLDFCSPCFLFTTSNNESAVLISFDVLVAGPPQCSGRKRCKSHFAEAITHTVSLRTPHSIVLYPRTVPQKTVYHSRRSVATN